MAATSTPVAATAAAACYAVQTRPGTTPDATCLAAPAAPRPASQTTLPDEHRRSAPSLALSATVPGSPDRPTGPLSSPTCSQKIRSALLSGAACGRRSVSL